MPNRYTGAKRRRYEQALHDFIHYGVTKRDAVIKMFVKQERFNPNAKVNPDPRAIQFRESRYCVVLSSYLYPIEHQIYSFKGASNGVPRSRNVAKGLNSVQRAELLLQKSEHFREPCFLGLDASRFDKHVSDKLLELEHLVYLKCNPDPLFRQLLSWQLRNFCVSNLGLAYKLLGRRMSGDMNTASGNCLIMLLMLIAYFMTKGSLKWDCLDDGDDVVVIIEKGSLPEVSDLVEVFLSFGMEMKLESQEYHLEKVVFCRSNPIQFRLGRWKFVRDWRNVVSNALCGVRHWEEPTYRKRVLAAVGTCELVLNLGVPILQAFAMAILRNCADGKAVDLNLATEGLRARTQRDLKMLGLDPKKLRAQPIDEVARASFHSAFGVCAFDQVRWEEWFSSWTFNCDGLVTVPTEIRVSDWHLDQSTTEVYSQ